MAFCDDSLYRYCLRLLRLVAVAQKRAGEYLDCARIRLWALPLGECFVRIAYLEA